jgi:hypothetical protein
MGEGFLGDEQIVNSFRIGLHPSELPFRLQRRLLLAPQDLQLQPRVPAERVRLWGVILLSAWATLVRSTEARSLRGGTRSRAEGDKSTVGP